MNNRDKENVDKPASPRLREGSNQTPKKKKRKRIRKQK